MTLIAISICSVLLIAVVIFRLPSRKRKIRELQLEIKAQQFSPEKNQGRKDSD